MTRARVHELVDRIVRRCGGTAREAMHDGAAEQLTLAQLKDQLCELLVAPAEADVAAREAKVREAGDIFAAGDGWQTRGECEEWMREALGLPPPPFPHEVCGSSNEYDPCGLVEHHTNAGAPLCHGC